MYDFVDFLFFFVVMLLLVIVFYIFNNVFFVLGFILCVIWLCVKEVVELLFVVFYVEDFDVSYYEILWGFCVCMLRVVYCVMVVF